MRAWLDHDVAAVDAMMGSEFTYIGPDGQVLDRQVMLSIVSSPSYRLEWGTRSEVLVVPLADGVAAVVSRWQGEGSYQGRHFKDDHRCTSVFVRSGPTWRIVFEHCCAIIGSSAGTEEK